MSIIDTHAHVFPSVRDRIASQLPEGLLQTFDEWLHKISAPPGFEVVKGYWLRWLQRLEEKDIKLDIETVARFQSHFHPQIFRALEGLISTVLGPTQVLQGTIPNLLESMQRNGIDKTVVIASGPYCPNEWLLERAEEHPELIPVVSLPDLPPGSSVDDYGDALERLIAFGARGFKIHTNFDNLPSDHPAYRAYFEAAAANDLFIILHTGCFHVPQYKNLATPPLAEFETYFQDYRDVKVCLAHMNRDHPEAAWTMISRYANIFADTSWQTSANIRQTQAAIGLERILYGTDWPLLHNEMQKDALDVLTQALDETQLEKVTRDNPRLFLSL